MAYTQGFDHDLFISFSREDNLAAGGERGWVTQFREHLEVWLRRRGLRGVDIWWDQEQLRGNTDFDARIEQAIAGSALLLVLHSRNYRQSDYCHKELDWFVSHAERHPLGLAAGDQRRILNVLINNIPHQEWAAPGHWTGPLVGALGFELHDADNEDAFGDPIVPARFSEALRPLVAAITETLKAFPKEVPGAPPGDTRPSIFFADVADSLRPFRKRLIKEIGERAHVLDAVPPPLEREAHDEAIRQALAQADLSIHLVDQLAGREIDDAEDLTYPRHQADLAAASPASSLIWVPETLLPEDFDDDEQREWLEQLEEASRGASGYRFVRAGREPFVAQVLDTIERIRAERAGTESGPPHVLIDTHRKDQHHAYALAAGLTQRLPDLDLDFTKDAEGPDGWRQFEEGVRRARDLVVLFGQVAPDWVRGRVERAYKIAFGAETPSLENIWVLLLPHCPGMPQLPRLIRVEVLDNRGSDEIAPDNLQRLLPGGGRGGEV